MNIFYQSQGRSSIQWDRDQKTKDEFSHLFRVFFNLPNSIVLHGKETIQSINQEALEKIESAESGVKLLTGTTVENLNIAEQSLTLNNGKVLKYGKVLLATGGTPKTLPVLQGASEGKVTTFRSVEDFKKLHALVNSADKKIVIVGGGFLGSELAVAVSHFGTTLSTMWLIILLLCLVSVCMKSRSNTLLPFF